jgi:hypothetical protein
LRSILFTTEVFRRRNPSYRRDAARHDPVCRAGAFGKYPVRSKRHCRPMTSAVQFTGAGAAKTRSTLAIKINRRETMFGKVVPSGSRRFQSSWFRTHKRFALRGVSPDSNYVGNRTLCRWNRYHCVALRPPLFRARGFTMLPTYRPTPTCTRFKPTIEMPCMTCGVQMRLTLIEPQGPSYNLLTYSCVPCDSGESFLKAM